MKTNKKKKSKAKKKAIAKPKPKAKPAKSANLAAAMVAKAKVPKAPTSKTAETPAPAEEASAYDILKSQYQDFVDDMLVNGFNQTKAAERAGYKTRWAKSQGSRIMKLPLVLRALAERLKKRRKQHDDDVDETLNNAREIFDRCMGVSELEVDGKKVEGVFLFNDTGSLGANNQIAKLKGDYKPTKIEATHRTQEQALEEMEGFDE